METLFSKHEIEIIVRPEDYPGIMTNAYEIATVSIGEIIFVGEITNVQSKKIKDDDGEMESWTIVKIAVQTVASMCDCQIDHPSKKSEILDKVILKYDGSDTKNIDEEDFDFDKES